MENSPFDRLNDSDTRTAAPSIAKAVRVLDEVSRGYGAGISEIARRTGLGKSTVHALVNAMAASSLLEPAGEGRGYKLGPKLAELGMRAADQRILAAAMVETDAVARKTGETVFFGRLTGQNVVILVRQESSRSINLSAREGSTVPVHAGALGKAYLATMESAALTERARSWVSGARNGTDHEDLLADVDRASRQGYALERNEYLPGLCAAAAVLKAGGATYFFWTVGIDSVTDDAALDMAGRGVRDACRRIAERIEEQPSGPTVRSAS